MKDNKAKDNKGATALELIWYRDVSGFLQDDRLSKFIPMPSTTLAEQLNALLRLALYYSAFVFVARGSFAVLYIPLVTAAATYLVYQADEANDNKMVEALGALDVVRDRRTRKPCTRPTLDNPFMNVLVGDYGRFPQRPAACDISREAVAARAEQLHAHNLYKDSDDIFDRNASSRQFYTTASTTIPNDQEGFAKWLYETPPTCKEGNGAVCAGRLHKHVPGI